MMPLNAEIGKRLVSERAWLVAQPLIPQSTLRTGRRRSIVHDDREAFVALMVFLALDGSWVDTPKGCLGVHRSILHQLFDQCSAANVWDAILADSATTGDEFTSEVVLAA
jgi:transposase